MDETKIDINQSKLNFISNTLYQAKEKNNNHKKISQPSTALLKANWRRSKLICVAQTRIIASDY